MPANSRWDLIQRLNGFKLVKNPGNGRLSNLNDPVLNVLIWKLQNGDWKKKKNAINFTLNKFIF